MLVLCSLRLCDLLPPLCEAQVVSLLDCELRFMIANMEGVTQRVEGNDGSH